MMKQDVYLCREVLQRRSFHNIDRQFIVRMNSRETTRGLELC